jgi:DNA polymerase-3 subunit gamma/tau
MALARHYRPHDFSGVIGQDQTVLALKNSLDNNRLHHAYLFTGTRGVGKTTLARLLAKSLNCAAGLSGSPCHTCSPCQTIDAGRFPDLIEIDAASKTKVEDTRDLLDKVIYAPTQGRYKVYLIDEVHMLSGHSFNALLKTLEEPPEHVIFILATTDPQRIPPTVLSRCLQFHLRRISHAAISAQLSEVLRQEGIAFEKEAADKLAKAARGSLRDGLSLLDQAIAIEPKGLTSLSVHQMLGLTQDEHLVHLLEAIAHKNTAQLTQVLSQIAEQLVDYKQLLSEIQSALHTLAFWQGTPSEPSATATPAGLLALQTAFSPEDIQLCYQIATLGQRDLAWAPSQQIGFEITLLRMAAFEIKPSPKKKS